MPLLTIPEAIARLVEHSQPLSSEVIDLATSPGRVLATDAVADQDSPPFRKAMMDGFAVRTESVVENVPQTVVGEVAAGAVSEATIQDGQTVRIMTGAPVPNGADAVIPIERCRVRDVDSAVEFEIVPRIGQNVLGQGEIVQSGQTVVPQGRLIGPAELAALAEFGVARVTVRKRPRVAVLATGDELVPVDQMPGPGQIRNTNGPMLAAQVSQFGAEAVPLGIARDHVDDLDVKIAAGLENDVLILSGGVSAGQYDLVPERLAAAGATEVFHKVAIKPGKPIWFGLCPRGNGSNETPTLILGLPGNPVSSLVCCHLFVQTVLCTMLGRSPAFAPMLRASLAGPHRSKGGRTTYWPAVYETADGRPTATPLPWKGSADLVTVAAANAWIVTPPGDADYVIGDAVDVLPMRTE